MRFTLDRDDLRPEFRDINYSQTRFEHFTDKAQRAIYMSGKATFYEYDLSNYNTIYAPKENK
jgi:serine/threonine-protein kinase RIO1